MSDRDATSLPVSAATVLGRPADVLTQRAAARVIVDNDFAGDPDGLVALAHQLLSPKTRTVLVTSTPLDAKLASAAGLDAGRTGAAGARLAGELIDLIGAPAPPPVVTGAEHFGAGWGQASAAAKAIVREALRDDPLPLILTCGGPLTNVAAALRLDPTIAERMTVMWIGGTAAADGGAEYNLSTDLDAVRSVLELSRVPLWQVPVEEYRRFQVSVAELTDDFRAISPLARWLYSRYLKLPPFVQLGGTVTFGDSPLVSLTALDRDALVANLRRVRRLDNDGMQGDEVAGREVHMVRGLDPRLSYADFRALMRLHARAKGARNAGT